MYLPGLETLGLRGLFAAAPMDCCNLGPILETPVYGNYAITKPDKTFLRVLREVFSVMENQIEKEHADQIEIGSGRGVSGIEAIFRNTTVFYKYNWI